MKYSYYTWDNVDVDMGQLVSFIESSPLEQQPQTDFTAIKNTSTRYIKYGLVRPYIESIVNSTALVNEREIGYDIYPMRDTDNINYNVYDVGNEYDFHIDIVQYPYIDRKLTVTINLTNDYDGGEFILQDGKEYILKSYKVLMFKSLMRHKVAPVTRGVRKSLTFWFEGPNWR